MATEESGTRKDCLACRLNADPSGVPGGRIKEYDHWYLEHIIAPVPITGWLILKTKRHTEGITGLNQREAEELGTILGTVPKILQALREVPRVYVCCFTEWVGHLHFHLIPQPSEEKYHGSKVFDLQREAEEGKRRPLPDHEVVHFVARLRDKL